MKIEKIPQLLINLSEEYRKLDSIENQNKHTIEINGDVVILKKDGKDVLCIQMFDLIYLSKIVSDFEAQMLWNKCKHACLNVALLNRKKV